MRKIIIFTFILALVLIFAGLWYWEKNPYSKEVLKVEILGPDTVSIFDEVEYTVKYKNNGNLRLEEPKLVFEFPEYSMAPLNSEENKANVLLLRKEIDSSELGDIYPGEEKVIKLKARLFGKEGDIKTAKATISYKPKNLNAKYESSTTHSSVIKPISLTFDFDLPTKIESGKNLSFFLNYFSSLNYPLTDLGIKIEYPSGFEFVSGKPKPLDKGEWEIPLLNKTDGGRVEIQGKLSGNTKDQKVFKATIGVWQNDNSFIVLKEVTRVVEIGQPRLDIIQKVNGSQDYTASPGDILHYEIFFRNLGEEPFTDLFLIAKFDGAGYLDFNSIRVDSGKSSFGDNSVVWDYNSVPKLKFLGRGEEGKVEFWVNMKNTFSGSQNATIKNAVLASSTKAEFEVKIKSKLAITQKAFYNDEVFGNTGPVPPVANQTTTYTIVWEARNYGNYVKNVTVKAILPDNVKLTGRMFPESEISNFSYDSQSHEIVWKVNNSGTLNPGAGVNGAPPSISFQISLIPDASQRGQNAAIIGQAKIKGEDQWTDDATEGTSKAITTQLPDDPISSNMGIVR